MPNSDLQMDVDGDDVIRHTPKRSSYTLASAAFLYPQSYLTPVLPSLPLSPSSTLPPMWSADVIAPPVAINSWIQTDPLHSALKETVCPQ